MRNEMTPTHIPHGRLVHFLDLSGNPGNKAACTDERHPRRWELAMPNRIQRRKVDTTKLVYLRHRQLVCERMVSGFAPRSGMKTARMANATNPKSAIGLAECGAHLPSRTMSSLRPSRYTAPVYTPPTARTGRLAGAQFPGAAVYALPTAGRSAPGSCRTRWNRPSAPANHPGYGSL